MELNAQQQKAVGAADGPVLIVAGPGTGKTKTLIARIEHLIASGRTRSDQILALTFTKKAAQEMQKRLSVGTAQRPKVTTFHALCYELLQSKRQKLITFITEPQRLAIIKKLPKPASLKHLSTRELGLVISRTKNSLEGGGEVERNLTQSYNETLQAQGLNDFDDLLQQTHQLLKNDKQTRQAVQARFSHILIDEFQDTNHLQYELLRLLLGHDNIFVIGDPKQSIYGFRGASGDIFDRFKADFPHCQQIDLVTNYRCAPDIVRLSNAIFGGELKPHNEKPGQVHAVLTLNEYSESQWVLSQIQQAIGGSDFHTTISDDTIATHQHLNAFAIIYRSRSAAVVVQRAIAQSGLPYQIVGDGSPYDQPQVQSLISLIKAHHHGEEVEIKGFSKVQCQKLLAKVVATDSPQALAQRIADVFGFEPTSAIKQFFNALVRFSTVEEALRHLDSIAENDFYDPAADAISLMTIHSAKGLEFEHVFLIGAEEGVLPNAKANLQEEHRLFYVAATRAKQRLDILHTKFRAGKPTNESRFITKLSDAVLPKIIDPQLQADKRRAQKRQAKRAQTSLF